MNTSTGEHLPECHFHCHPDLHFVNVTVGEFHNQPAPTLKVHHPVNTGRIQRGHQLVDGIGEELGFFIGEFIGLELVFSLAFNTDPYCLSELVHLRCATFLAPYTN